MRDDYSSEDYKLIFDKSLEGIMLVNFNGVVLDANESLIKLLGFKRSEFVGKNIISIIPELRMNLKEVMNAFKGIIDGSFKGDREWSFTNKAGREVTIHAIHSVFNSSQGKRILIIINDVTERKKIEDEIRSVSRFPEENPNPVIRLDTKGKILYTNPIASKLMTCKNIKDLFKKAKEALKSEKNLTMDLPCDMKWFSVTFTPFKNEGYINIYATEITERKNAELELSDSESKLSTIFNSNKDGMVFLNRTGKILKMNNSITELGGYSEEDIVGKRFGFLKMFTKKSLARLSVDFAKIISGKKVPSQVYSVKTKDGNLKLVDIQTSAVKDKGEVVGVVSVIRDVTERRRLEEEMKNNLSLLNSSIESTNDGILVIDNAGRVSLYNKRFIELWRIPKKLVELKDDKKLLDYVFNQLSDAQGFLKKVNYLYAHPSETSQDTIHFKDGRVFERYSQPQIVGEEIIGRVWSFRDVTKREKAEYDLQVSETRYRRLFEAARDGILILDYDTGMIVDVNPYMIEILGYSRKEFLGKNIWNIGYFKDVIANKAKFLELQKKGYVHYENLSLETKGGKEFFVEFVSNVYNVDNKKVIQCNIRDITERRKAELELSDSEERLKQIIMQNPYPIEVHSPDGTTLMVNDAHLKLFGLKSADLIVGKYNIFKDQIVAKMGLMDEIRKAYNGERVFLPEVRMPLTKVKDLYKGGKFGEAILEATIFPVMKEGRVWRVVTIWNDVTERKKIEGKLKESNEIFNHALDMLCIAGFDGYFKVLNPSWTRLLGWSEKELLSKPWLEFVHPEDKEQTKHIKSIIINGKEVYQFENRYLCKDGGIKWLSWNSYPDPDNKVMYGVARDVTEQRVINERLIMERERFKSLIELSEHKDVNKSELMSCALEECVRFTKSEVGYFHLYDESSKDITLTLWSKNVYNNCYNPEATHYELNKAGIWADSVRQRKPVIHNDYPRAKNKKGCPKGHFQVLRHLSVPVFDKKKIVAVIGVGNKGEPYSDYDVNQLKLFTANAWNMISEKESQESINNNLKNLRFMSDALTELITNPEISIYDFIAEKFHELVPESNVIISVRSPDDKMKVNSVILNDNASGFEKKAVKIFRNKAFKLDKSLMKSDNKFALIEINRDNMKKYITGIPRFIVDRVLKYLPKMNIVYLYSKGDIKATVTFHGVTELRNKEFIEALANVLSLSIERWESDNELIDSEKRFRSIIENSVDGVLIADVSTKKFVTCNKAIAEMLGYKEDELIRLSVDDIHPKESLDYVKKQFMKQYKRELLTITLPVKRKDNSVFYAEVTAFPVNLSGKEFNVGFFRDTTERVKADEAIKKSEESFRTLFETANEGIVSLDAKGKVSSINPKALELAGGLKEEEIVGKNIIHLMPEFKLDAREMFPFFLKMIKGKRIGNKEWTITNKKGRKITLTVNFSAIKKEGKTVGLSCMLNDVTERREFIEQLTSSEDEFRTIFNSTNTGIAIIDLTGRILRVNDRIIEFSGYKLKELVGKRFSQLKFISRGTLLTLLSRLTKIISGGVSKPREIDVKTKKGEHKKVRLVSKLFALKGKKCVIVTFEDVTEREIARQALIESEERFKALFEEAPDAYFLIDYKGYLINGNNAAERMIGGSRKDYVGKNILKAGIIPLRDIPRVARFMKEAGTKGIPMPEEYTIKRKDGKEVPIELTASVISVKGKPIMLGIARDITEREIARHALEDSEKKYRELTENTSDIIYSINNEGLITYISPQVENYGIKQKELISKPLLEIVIDDDKERIKEELDNFLKTGNDLMDYFRMVDKEGNIKIFEEKSKLNTDSDGNIIGSTGVLRDVTDKRLRDEEINKLRKDEEANRIRKEFLMLVTHELKQPLTPIMGYADLLKEGIVDVEKLKYLDRIINSAQDMYDLTTRIINLIKLETGQITIEFKNVELSQLISESLSKRASIINLKNIKIIKKVENIKFKADYILMRDVIVNILDNAIKFSEKDTTIEVNADYSKDYVNISIKDNGEGISEEELPNLFNTFQQGAEGQLRGGFGIGLALCKMIVDKHKGRILVDSKKGKGSTFKIKIPRKGL